MPSLIKFSVAIALAAVAFVTPTHAVTVTYDDQVGLVGTLGERQGVDCCINGKERKVRFPALILEKGIDVKPPPGPKTEMTPNAELGVTVLHLAMSGQEQMKVFQKHKGQKARVQCNIFRAETGHHLTPVMCQVVGIGPAQGF
jgi:Domain of unknown function (DUF4431)